MSRVGRFSAAIFAMFKYGIVFESRLQTFFVIISQNNVFVFFKKVENFAQKDRR